MEEIRCCKCNKKLAEADYRRLAIKCPRCGVLNIKKATEPPNKAHQVRYSPETRNGPTDP